jgi:hypothetical protein
VTTPQPPGSAPPGSGGPNSDTKEQAKAAASDVKETAKANAANVKDTAQQQVSEVTQAASAAAQDVAQTTKQQVSAVADEASQRAREIADQLITSVNEQASHQQQRAVSGLRGLADGVQDLADGRPAQGPAQDIARSAASQLQSAVDYLDSREPSDLLNDVRDFARRRPGMFLLGAAVAGFAVGRLVKGATGAGQQLEVGGRSQGDSASSTSQPIEPSVAIGLPPETAPTPDVYVGQGMYADPVEPVHGDPLARDTLVTEPLASTSLMDDLAEPYPTPAADEPTGSPHGDPVPRGPISGGPSQGGRGV